jgi:hypothetical protein
VTRLRILSAARDNAPIRVLPPTTATIVSWLPRRGHLRPRFVPLPMLVFFALRAVVMAIPVPVPVIHRSLRRLLPGPLWIQCFLPVVCLPRPPPHGMFVVGPLGPLPVPPTVSSRRQPRRAFVTRLGILRAEPANAPNIDLPPTAATSVFSPFTRRRVSALDRVSCGREWSLPSQRRRNSCIIAVISYPSYISYIPTSRLQ